MSVLWLREKLLKELAEKRQAVTDTLLAGVKDMSQYEFLRGRYSSLVDVENDLRELLGKVIEDDEDEQGGSSVLDPTLLDKSALERMPTPTGWRMLILPFAGMGVSKGGIIMTKDTVDRERLSTVCAYVVKMGPLCYKDDKFGDKPWCEEKQWVLIGRYAGARFKLGDDAECRIINDDEVIATIHDPTDIVAV
jgi:co-chaperonin GroES (HSP10)